MKISRIIVFLVLLASVMHVYAQDEKWVEVYVEQDGRKFLLNNQTVKLERKPFTLIFIFNKPEEVAGIYMNTSFRPEPYYMLLPSQEIPDLPYVPQKVLSEYKFNPHKELKVHSEFFQYLGYNPARNWNKFDRVEHKDGKIIAYRRVENLDLVEQRQRIPVGRNHRDLYLFFTVLHKTGNPLRPVEEWQRFKGKIKF